MNIVRMAQGSPEWHEHRRKYRNASETPAVLGVSPWQTPYQLWQVKLGLVEQQVTPAMRHGSDMEPAARAAYETQTGRVMQPLVVVDGEYSASLDGMTLAGDRIVEIKCPVKGRESTLWQAVAAGELPEHYRWQVQHQLLVTSAAVADVFVFDGAAGVLLEIAPAPETWPQIQEAWDKFATFIESKTPPPLSKGDVRERNDAEWFASAAHYLEMKLFAEQAQKELVDAKDRLVALTSHSSETGGGVTVTRYWKQGSIEYRKIQELKALDLDKYRGAPREETRINAT
jgi:putative phage-type endonuclease